MVEGMSIREAAREYRAAPGHGEEDVEVLGATGVPAEQARPQSEAGAVHRSDRRDTGRG